jgi:hypothetical protein
MLLLAASVGLGIQEEEEEEEEEIQVHRRGSTSPISASSTCLLLIV